VGLFKSLKEARALVTSAAPAARTPGSTHQQPHGMMAGFAAVMGQMMGPLLAAQAPERGAPLPATEPEVIDELITGAADADGGQSGVAAVRARDSAFDAAVFTTFAGQVFAAISSVWGTGDAAPVRGLMADPLWEPLSAALASGMGAGPGAMYANQVGQATLCNVWAGSSYDSAHVKFAVTLHLPPGQAQEVPPGFGSWTEDWLLQRSVTPGGDPTATPETCPSCGAPTETDAWGVCTHCHQPVPVLTSGWLVTCVHTHNPMVEMVLAQIVNTLDQDPTRLAMLPDDLVKLLPADVVGRLDPQRAAALHMEP
jgi:hypothetical protein